MNMQEIVNELEIILDDAGDIWNSSGSHEVAEYMFYEIEGLYNKLSNEEN